MLDHFENEPTITSSHAFHPPMNCRKLLFVDLGANKGAISAAFVKCLHSNPLTKKIALQIHAFEPLATIHERFVSMLEDVKMRFEEPDVNDESGVYLHKKVAWIYDGTVKFRVGRKARNTNSAVSDVLDQVQGKQCKLQRARDIECVDISIWLRKLVNKEQFDSVFVKMDIEGSEYRVLDKMIADDSLALIDRLFVEFHKKFLDVSELDTVNEYIVKMHAAAPRLRIYKEVESSYPLSIGDLDNRYSEVQR